MSKNHHSYKRHSYKYSVEDAKPIATRKKTVGVKGKLTSSSSLKVKQTAAPPQLAYITAKEFNSVPA